MHKPKQSAPIEQCVDRPKRQVIYVPPEVEEIDQFAQDVCDQFKWKGNSDCGTPEIVNGFAAFLNFVAEVTAKQLNQKNKVKEGV